MSSLLKVLTAVFLLAILHGCASPQQVASRTFVSDFDESQYISPQDFGYPLSIKEIEQNPPVDSSFTPVSVQGGMHRAFGQINYPAQAQENDIQGKVILRLYVNKTAKLAKIVVRESPHELLTIASLKAAKSWQYNAAILNKIAVNSFIHVPINFRTQTQKIKINSR